MSAAGDRVTAHRTMIVIGLILATLIVVSVLIAAELGGLVGALLAIPAAAIARILFRDFVPAGRRSASVEADDG
ncbi:hypothetical protein [Micromonospora palythoicola]|uniref:hypothetical protein n=1 Tax=Micromonospora palythoicola TaxID=3120507 RepID=UPI002FCE6273